MYISKGSPFVAKRPIIAQLIVLNYHADMRTRVMPVVGPGSFRIHKSSQSKDPPEGGSPKHGDCLGFTFVVWRGALRQLRVAQRITRTGWVGAALA